MRVFALETSCDETSVSIVSERDGVFEIEKNVLSSQAKIHATYGGVVPEVAAREHAIWIFPLMKETGVAPDGSGIDAIAVTVGPGLIPALRVGVELGKTLAWSWGKPLIAVNHLEGHIYSVWLERRETPTFPALCLLVSGGHTELIQMVGHGTYKLLGMTRDDAAGEAFDKVAKLIGLPYPGGPAIAKAALDGNAAAIAFPRPMLKSGDLDFSFAGLKTAVRVYLKEHREQGTGMSEQEVADIAASFQQAVVDTLVRKTIKAVGAQHPRSVILAGGVAANQLLRQTLQHKLPEIDSTITFHTPSLSFTGDNAAMIGAAGIMKAKRGEFVDPLTLMADPNLRLA